MEDEKNNSIEKSKGASSLEESFNQFAKDAESQVEESVQKSQRNVPKTPEGLKKAATEIISNSKVDLTEAISEKI